VTTLVEPEVSFEGGLTPYVRARFDASGYFPVSDAFVLARASASARFRVPS
jgi:translocation and assembly module TamA